jgi:UPF0042 nucleotide-binding protein
VTHVLVITGLSGGGRSTAADAFEDQGWFVVDNLPPALLPKIGDLASLVQGPYQRVVLAMAGYETETVTQLQALRDRVDNLTIVFLEANDAVLVRRYESTKRRHPLVSGELSLIEAIKTERKQLAAARADADVVIDTSDLNPHQLTERIVDQFMDLSDSKEMRITVSSFGFKHGLPLDVDMVLDCRFLPNPHWEPELRPKTGQDEAVADYVLEREVTQEFLTKLDDMLALLIPAYEDEGKSYLGVAFGCTGGRHRSVAVAERIAKMLNDRGWQPRVTHRDVTK